MSPPTWTQSQIDITTRMWLAGKSATHIGKVIGKSKDMVTGKIRRLGLPRHVVVTAATIKRRAKIRDVKRGMTFHNPIAGCRFPMWGDREAPTHAYCGEIRRIDSSYCPTHHARCYIRSNHQTQVRSNANR